MAATVLKFCAAVLLVFAGIIPAVAQSQRIVAEIPFDFNVGDQAMAPGSYELRHMNNGVVYIRSRASGRTVMFMTMAGSTLRNLEKPALRFNRYGDQYFLAQLDWPQFQLGRAVIQSKTETALARKIPAKQRTVVTER